METYHWQTNDGLHHWLITGIKWMSWVEEKEMNEKTCVDSSGCIALPTHEGNRCPVHAKHPGYRTGGSVNQPKAPSKFPSTPWDDERPWYEEKR